MGICLSSDFQMCVVVCEYIKRMVGGGVEGSVGICLSSNLECVWWC